MEVKISSWCFFCCSKAPAWSLQAQLRTGEGTPSLFPVPAERGQGLPQPQLRKWHRPPTSHSEETPGRPEGEARKQRASELPDLYAPQFGWSQHEDLLFSPKGHCHKMARIARCEGALPSGPVSSITFLGKLPFKQDPLGCISTVQKKVSVYTRDLGNFSSTSRVTSRIISCRPHK